MEQPNVQLINGDCLVELPKIPRQSIDCILVDLPYGVLKNTNPLAQWDKEMPLDKLWKQWLRLRRNERTPIILFGQGLFTAKLIMSQPRLFKYTLVWDKINRSTGFLNANRMPLRIHEDICVFYEKLPTYKPQFTYGEKNHKRGLAGNGGGNAINRCYGNFKQQEAVITNEKYPTSILRFHKEQLEKTVHGTQKPVKLMQYLIRTYSNEGDTILDNCMGSGTTGVAAIKEHRNFIGMELNEEYFNIAQKRIDLELRQPTLF